MPERVRLVLRALVDDPFTKLAALLLAFAAWLWVQYQETDKGLVRVGLEFRLPDGLVTLDDPTLWKVAQVEGPRVAVRRARNATASITVDLTTETLGPVVRVLDPGQVEGLPGGVRVEGFTDEGEVRVTLDEVLRRRVAVLPQFVGRPAEHHQLGRTLLEPDVVEVEGARSRVEGVVDVRTVPIDVSGWTEDTRLAVQLDLPRGIRPVEPWKGTAQVAVASLLTVQRFDEVRVVVPAPGWEPGDGFDRISVQLRGPRDAVRQIPPQQVLAVVELPDPPQGEVYTVAFEAEVAPRYTLVFPRSPGIEVAVEPPPLQVVRR
ncbi:MAG: YbbR-like domain-containing protein [Alphaproteobacteria bacterium]|nr:YbbR-like domain-containing protein [Alphaproteobacteria bacterium]